MYTAIFSLSGCKHAKQHLQAIRSFLLPYCQDLSIETYPSVYNTQVASTVISSQKSNFVGIHVNTVFTSLFGGTIVALLPPPFLFHFQCTSGYAKSLKVIPTPIYNAASHCFYYIRPVGPNNIYWTFPSSLPISTSCYFRLRYVFFIRLRSR